MNNPTYKRNIYNVNPYEKRMLRFIFLYATIPLFFVILFFYVIFYDLIIEYINSGLAQHFLKQFLMLAALITIYYLIFCRIVFQHVNRLAGFYPRILQELDNIIEGSSQSHLKLREDDYAEDLIIRINQLIDKIENK